MSESTWSAEGEPPPKKRKLPVWLWWCGGGCLLGVILVALLGVWGVKKAKELLDPEAQWASIQEIQPFDQRPAGWTPLLGLPLGRTSVYTLSAPGQVAAVLMRFRGKDANEARAALLDEKHSGAFMGFGGRRDITKSTLEIQGRELTVLRFYQGKGGGPGAEKEGHSAMVDTTRAERADELVLWQFIRPAQPFSDDELRGLLEPWDVGGDD